MTETHEQILQRISNQRAENLMAAHEENAKLREELGSGTTGLKYKAELYDEVWGAAKSMGFANVTDALAEITKLREEHDAALRLAYARADTAEQRAEKLREELDKAEGKLEFNEKGCRALQAQKEAAEQRAEAAEARIKEAEGQEPAVNITDGAVTWSQVPKGFNGQLFFGPIPPADVAEKLESTSLTEEVEDILRSHIAELERKLEYWRDLAKARAEAVPEDAMKDAQRYRALISSGKYGPSNIGDYWGLATGLPYKYTKAEMDEAVDKAMLAAAPKPGVNG